MSFSAAALDEEDCSYLLRDLESTAFSHVVSAMRAQGMLNKFKEVVLEHLKLALFVTDEQYKAEMRRAANDEHLSRVAEVLNPSYDTYTTWGTLGCEIVDDVTTPSSKWFGDSSTQSCANALLSLASSHNDALSERDSSLAQLLQLPKTPFVPERLRLLLRDTESLHTDRILPKEPVVVEKRAVVPKAAARAPPKGRKRKTKTAVEVKEECAESTSAEQPIAKPVNIPVGKENGAEKSLATCMSDAPLLTPQKKVPNAAQPSPAPDLLPLSKDAENLGVKEFLHKIQQQIQEEALTGQPEPATRKKRKTKQATQAAKELPGAECARARPFMFEPAVNGIKPPRGNPDKRWGPPKRSPTTSTSVGFSPPPQNASPSSQTPSSLATLSSLPSGVPPLSSAPVTGIQAAASSVVSPGVSSQQQAVAASNPNSVVKDTAMYAPVSILRKQTSPVPPSTVTVLQKTVPVQQSVYKRPRVGSFTETAVNMHNLEPGTSMPRASILKTSRSTLISQSASPGKLKLNQPLAEQVSAATAYGNPTRTYYGNPSVAALNRANQMRSATNVPVQSMPSSSPVVASAMDGTAYHGHDYGVTRPIIKRSLYKTGPGGVRLLNGSSQSTTRVFQQQPSCNTGPPPPAASPVSNTPNSTSPSPVPIGRKLYPLAAHNPQMPVGQFLMGRASPTLYASGSETVVEPTLPKRVIYCDPNLVNPCLASQPRAESSMDGCEPSTSSAQFNGGLSAELHIEPNASYDRPNSSLRIVSTHAISPSVPSPFRDGVRISPTQSQPPSSYPVNVAASPQPFEGVRRVFLLQPQDSASSTHMPPEQGAAVDVVIERSGPSVEQDSPPVTDILQQSMMEIS